MFKRINWFISLLLVNVILFPACSKFDSGTSNKPTVSNSLDSSTTTTATITVKVNDYGLYAIKFKGICWSTSSNPTYTSNSHITDSIKSGTISFLITGLTPSTIYFARGYAINIKGDSSYGMEISFRTPAISPFSFGQFYSGGLIFHIDTSGLHGLVCDTTDLSDSSVWTNNISDKLIASGIALGTGFTNTTNIIDKYPHDSSCAAWICKTSTRGGHNDWYLPSKDELNLVRKNLYALGFGSWTKTAYWSSSDYVDPQGHYFAWSQYFANGYQYYFKQSFPLSVRAVRAF